MTDRHRSRRAVAALGAMALLAASAAGCGSDTGSGPEPRAGSRVDTSPAAAGGDLPRGAEPVDLDPADFTTRIDNPYLPMAPGSRWVYNETSADGERKRVDVAVTDRTKRVAGIEARVVHDVVTEGGRVVEDTFDWYAQDRAGNVWYLGETTKEFEPGKPPSTKGSWEAGVDRAQPGIAMPARPRIGLDYRQEHHAGEAEDRGRVVGLDEQAEVPAGHYTRALMTRDSNPLEPRVLEYKLYARGVGLVLALQSSGGSGREELVRFERGRR